MLQHKEKYLFIPYVKGGGLDSKIYDLEIILYTALSMGRIPIINEMVSPPIHRLDNKKVKMPIYWDKYMNLSAAKILKVEPCGAIKESPDTLRYIYEHDFDFSVYSEDQIRYIDKTQLHDKENKQYPIIFLLKTEDILKLKELPSLEKSGRIANLNGRIDVQLDPSLLIVIPPSEEVNNLTDIVLKHFGTTREDMRTLFNILYDLPRYKIKHENYLSDNSENRYIANLGCYACMHVRYGGNHREVVKMIKKSDDLMLNIQHVVNQVYDRHSKKLPLYIMSNIMEADYFDFLKPRYDIYRYSDFREIKERFTAQEHIDHHLLYSVEKNIMRYALVKIFPKNRNLFTFEGPWRAGKRGLAKSALKGDSLSMLKRLFSRVLRSAIYI